MGAQQSHSSPCVLEAPRNPEAPVPQAWQKVIAACRWVYYEVTD